MIFKFGLIITIMKKMETEEKKNKLNPHLLRQRDNVFKLDAAKISTMSEG